MYRFVLSFVPFRFRAYTSLIADGHHVDFAAIRIAKRAMGHRLFCITDAVTDCNEGLYQHSYVHDRYECNGVLSGSAISMHGTLLNLVRHCGIDLDEALRMCSLYPAEVVGAAEWGRLEPGSQAAMVVLDAETLALLGVGGWGFASPERRGWKCWNTWNGVKRQRPD